MPPPGPPPPPAAALWLPPWWHPARSWSLWQIHRSLKESITESHFGFSVGLGFFGFFSFLFYYRLSLWPVFLWLERGVSLAGRVGRLAPRMIMCFPLLSVKRDVLA